MNKVHALLCIVAGPPSTGYSVPVRFFEHEEDAKREAYGRQAAIETLIEGSIIVATPNGPKKAGTVKELMGLLGVTGFNHAVIGGDIAGKVDVPQPKIFLAGN